MADPNIGPSDEVIAHAWEEDLLIGTDWKTWHQINVAGFSAVSAALKDATDPSEVLALTELKGEALNGTIGSLSLWQTKEATLQERQAFEAALGN